MKKIILIILISFSFGGIIHANMDAGYHSIVWDANSYASGVYFVKMMAGEFVNTQKLMLVK